jgi:hypothetical protein
VSVANNIAEWDTPTDTDYSDSSCPLNAVAISQVYSRVSTASLAIDLKVHASYSNHRLLVHIPGMAAGAKLDR